MKQFSCLKNDDRISSTFLDQIKIWKVPLGIRHAPLQKTMTVPFNTLYFDQVEDDERENLISWLQNLNLNSETISRMVSEQLSLTDLLELITRFGNTVLKSKLYLLLFVDRQILACRVFQIKDQYYRNKLDFLLSFIRP